MRTKTAAILGCLALAALYAPAASAATVTFSSLYPTIAGSGSHATDWNDTIAVPRFNPALGTLNAITLTLFGTISSDVHFENTDSTAYLVETSVSGTFTLRNGGDTADLVVTTPVNSFSEQVDASDETDDFDGASGRTYLSLSASDDQSFVSALAGDLVVFTGSGSIILPLRVVGLSSASRSGNLTILILSRGGAFAEVTYDYSPAEQVSEPASLFLVGVSMVALAALRLRAS